MTKVFSKALMASESIQSYVGSTKFQADNEYAKVVDGAFVVLGDLALDGVYGVASVDYNVYKSAAPTALTDKVVVCDLAEVEAYTHGDNRVKMGNKLVDLEAEAGHAVRFRRLAIGDKFWLGEGNFEVAPGENKYATLTANKTTLTPAAAKPEEGFALKIIASEALTVGQYVKKNGSNFEQLYLCEVVAL
jgi:hypothetical protein